MLVLVMTAAHMDERPPVCFEFCNQIATVHVRIIHTIYRRSTLEVDLDWLSFRQNEVSADCTEDWSRAAKVLSSNMLTVNKRLPCPRAGMRAFCAVHTAVT